MEKERYVSYSAYNYAMFVDTEKNETMDISDITKFLNQQDARIKELEKETYPAYKREHQRRAYLENIEIPKLKERIKELEEENQQLKQSQKELEISELEKLKDFFLEPYRDEEMGTEFLITTKNTGKIAEYVLDRIKSLKGEQA